VAALWPASSVFTSNPELLFRPNYVIPSDGKKDKWLILEGSDADDEFELLPPPPPPPAVLAYWTAFKATKLFEHDLEFCPRHLLDLNELKISDHQSACLQFQ